MTRDSQCESGRATIVLKRPEKLFWVKLGGLWTQTLDDNSHVAFDEPGWMELPIDLTHTNGAALAPTRNYFNAMSNFFDLGRHSASKEAYG